MFITGVPDIKNQGSFAMVKVALDEISKYYPDSSFIIHTDRKDNAMKCMEDNGYDVSIAKTPWNINNKKQFLREFYLKKSNESKQFFECIKSSDLVISVSGDCLSEVNGRMNIIEQVLIFDYAHKHNVKTYICAQTMGKFSKDIRWFVKRILKSVDLISIRENITYKYIKNIGIKNNIIRTEDLAFLLKPASEDRLNKILHLEGIKKEFFDNKTVAHFTNSWHYNNSFTDKVAQADKKNEYMKLQMKVIKRVLDQGFNILLLSHVFVEPYRDDIMNAELFNNLRKQSWFDESKIKIVRDQYYAHEYKKIISKCKFAISNRMHPTIAAVSVNVPTLLISNSHKAEGIIGNNFDNELYIDIRGLDSNTVNKTVLNKLEYMLTNYSKFDYSKQIEKILSGARLNFEQLERIVNK